MAGLQAELSGLQPCRELVAKLREVEDRLQQLDTEEGGAASVAAGSITASWSDRQSGNCGLFVRAIKNDYYFTRQNQA